MKKIKPKTCKLNYIENPGKNYVSGENHTEMMQTLPTYCKNNPEDKKALAKLFQHTYVHLHSFLYQCPTNKNYNPKYDLTQEEYQQECYIFFWKRLQSFKPERCRDANGWFGTVNFIKKDVERFFLNKWEKHTKNTEEDGLEAIKGWTIDPDIDLY